MAPALVRSLRRSCICSAGQAAPEYAALLLLVAVALGGAGMAVGGAGVPRRVVQVVRTGLCIVGGDVCRPVDAAADGLAPCLTHERTTGGRLTLTIAVLRLGHAGTWTVAERSDGSVLVTRVDDDAVGVGGGLGVSLSDVGVTLGVAAGLDLSIAHGSAWELPSSAAAARFLAAVRRGGLPNVAPTWRFGDVGDELQGSAVARLGAGGPSFTALDASAGASDGVRVGRGLRTVYFDVHAEAASPLVSLPGPASTTSAAPDGGNGGPLLLGVTRDAHGLRELSFERAQPGPRRGEIVDTVGRLDLRDPANRAAAEPLLSTGLPWPPRLAATLRAVVARTARAGTIERATYAITDRSHDHSLAVRVGIALGLDAADVDIDRRLIAASAWTRGSQERHRLDCAD